MHNAQKKRGGKGADVVKGNKAKDAEMRWDFWRDTQALICLSACCTSTPPVHPQGNIAPPFSYLSSHSLIQKPHRPLHPPQRIIQYIHLRQRFVTSLLRQLATSLHLLLEPPLPIP